MEALLSQGMWQAPSRSSSLNSSCCDTAEHQAPTLVSSAVNYPRFLPQP